MFGVTATTARSDSSRSIWSISPGTGCFLLAVFGETPENRRNPDTRKSGDLRGPGSSTGGLRASTWSRVYVFTTFVSAYVIARVRFSNRVHGLPATVVFANKKWRAENFLVRDHTNVHTANAGFSCVFLTPSCLHARVNEKIQKSPRGGYFIVIYKNIALK